MVHVCLFVDSCTDAALHLCRAVYCALVHGTKGWPMIWCPCCFLYARWPREPQ